MRVEVTTWTEYSLVAFLGTGLHSCHVLKVCAVQSPWCPPPLQGHGFPILLQPLPVTSAWTMLLWVVLGQTDVSQQVWLSTDSWGEPGLSIPSPSPSPLLPTWVVFCYSRGSLTALETVSGQSSSAWGVRIFWSYSRDSGNFIWI